MQINYKNGLLIFSLLLILCLSLSVVNAADEQNIDMDNVEIDVKCIDEDSSINSVEDEQIGTLKELQSLINNNTNGTLKLEKDYEYNSIYDGYDEKKGVLIKKPIVIDGNGHTITGNRYITSPYTYANLFNITSCNVTLINFNFIDSSISGSIITNSTNTILINNTFINSSLTYSNESSGNIINCSFLDTNIICTAQSTKMNPRLDIHFENCTFAVGRLTSSSGYSHRLEVINCIFNNFNLSTCPNGYIINSSFYNKSLLKTDRTAHYGNIVNNYFYGSGLIINGNYSTLYNCTFENSYSTARENGGLFWNSSYGDLINCSFINCTSWNNKGAIYWNGNNSNMTNCSFINCFSSSDNCGAIFLNGQNNTISNCSFSNCSASSGGAIYVNVRNNTISNCSFINCSARGSGGAIWFENKGTVYYCSFINCSARGSGGAIYGKCEVINCSNFVGCSGLSGGAIYLDKLNNVTFYKCNFTNNSADRGGAIYSDKNVTGDLTFLDFVNNSARVEGGAIVWNGASLTIFMCDLINNSAECGGAIYSLDNNITIRSSLFSENNADMGSAIYYNNFLKIEKSNFTNNFVKSYNLLISFNNTHISANLIGGNNLLNAIYNNGSNYVMVDFVKINQSYYGINQTIILNMYDINDNLLGNLTKTTDDNGFIYESLEDLNYPYKIVMIHPQSECYSEISNSTICRYNTTISMSPVITILDNIVNFTVNVVSDYSVNAGNVIFSIDDVELGSADVKNGVVNYEYVCNKLGNFTIKFIYNGAGIFISSQNSSTLIVNKKETKLYLNNISCTLGETVTFVVNVVRDVEVNNTIVKFYVDEVKIGESRVVDGFAYLNYSANSSKIYNIKVCCDEEDIYNYSEVKSILVVNKQTVIITPTALSTTYNSGKVFQIKVVDTNQNPISGLKLTLKVYTGSSYQTVYVTTDATGIAKYSASKLAIGTHNVVVSLSNDIYVADSKNSSIKISKATVTITPTALSTTYDSGKYFQVKVLDANKKAVSGLKLTLKIYTGSKVTSTVTVTTNASGIAKYSASKLSIGTHKVIVSLSNTYYTASSKTSSIKVSKATTTVTAPVVKYKKGANKYFKVTVKNKATGKVVKSLAIKIKVYTGKTYKTYTVKTNTKGIAQLNTKALKKGTHKVVISSGNSNYAISKSGNLIVIK